MLCVSPPSAGSMLMAPASPGPRSSCPEAVVTLRDTSDPPSVPASTQADLHGHSQSMQLSVSADGTCWAATFLRAQPVSCVGQVCGLKKGEGWLHPVTASVHAQLAAMLVVTEESYPHQGNLITHRVRVFTVQDQLRAGLDAPGVLTSISQAWGEWSSEGTSTCPAHAVILYMCNKACWARCVCTCQWQQRTGWSHRKGHCPPWLLGTGSKAAHLPPASKP